MKMFGRSSYEKCSSSCEEHSKAKDSDCDTWFEIGNNFRNINFKVKNKSKQRNKQKDKTDALMKKRNNM